MSGRRIIQDLLPESQAEIIARLLCTEGHLRAVIRMVETGEPCELVLHQLDAVQAALKVIENKMVQHLVRQNTSMLQDHASDQDRREVIEALTSLFQRIQRTSTISNEADQ